MVDKQEQETSRGKCVECGKETRNENSYLCEYHFKAALLSNGEG